MLMSIILKKKKKQIKNLYFVNMASRYNPIFSTLFQPQSFQDFIHKLYPHSHIQLPLDKLKNSFCFLQ